MKLRLLVRSTINREDCPPAAYHTTVDVDITDEQRGLLSPFVDGVTHTVTDVAIIGYHLIDEVVITEVTDVPR